MLRTEHVLVYVSQFLVLTICSGSLATPSGRVLARACNHRLFPLSVPVQILLFVVDTQATRRMCLGPCHASSLVSIKSSMTAKHQDMFLG